MVGGLLVIMIGLAVLLGVFWTIGTVRVVRARTAYRAAYSVQQLAMFHTALVVFILTIYDYAIRPMVVGLVGSSPRGPDGSYSEGETVGAVESDA